MLPVLTRNTQGGAAHGGSTSKDTLQSVKGRYQNPWESARPSIRLQLSQIPFERRRPVLDEDTVIKTVKPLFTAPESRLVNSNAVRIKATWLGHASVLVQFYVATSSKSTGPINVLFDPVFSQRASPVSWAGPEKRIPAPCAVGKLPRIHAVCISHNHYDHLDVETIAKLIKHDMTNRTKYYVPKGCGKTLEKAGVSPDGQIVETHWDQKEVLKVDQGTSLRFTCTPAQHNSSRKLVDANASLWCSWVVSLCDGSGQQIPGSNVFFAGDTGYRATDKGQVCPAFEQIGEHFKSIDLALIPIWRGGMLSGLSRLGVRLKPDAFVRHHHCTPEDAVQIHKDVRAKTSLAIHHSTFVGDYESRWCIQLLKKACEKAAGQSIAFQRGDSQTSGARAEGTTFVVLDAGASLVI